MMGGKKIVPKRRFEGFTDNWQKKMLKELRDENDRYSFTGGPFGSDLKSEDYTESGVRIIQLQNIGDGYFSNQYKIYTSEQKAKSLSTNLIYPNEIIIAKMAEPLARAAIIPEYDPKYLMSSDGIRLKVDTEEFYTYFLMILINSEIFRSKALENSTGTTRKRIGLVTLGNLPSNIPEYKEQKRIGQFFKHLDDMIALQQKKIDKTKALKSAYLAEMFPAEGERVPKRRFAGFTSEWVTHQIGDIFTVTRGNVLSTSKVSSIKTSKMQYPVYSSQTLNNGLLGYYDQYLYNKAITWTTDGANAGTVNYRAGKFYSTNVNGVLLSNDGYSCLAVAEALNQIAWKHVSKVGNPKLMNDVMSKIFITLPSSYDELNKISTFLNNINEIISNHQQKTEKLKATKQAYLNEMFV